MKNFLSVILTLITIPISAFLSFLFYYLVGVGILGKGLYRPDSYGSIELKPETPSLIAYLGVFALIVSTLLFFTLLPLWTIKARFNPDVPLRISIKLFIITFLIVLLISLIGKIIT